MPEVDQEFCELIQEVRNGSEEAAATLVRKYAHHVAMTARKLLPAELRTQFDSEDFVQAVWASFFTACVQREDFTNPGRMVLYLIGMARNKVKSASRDQTDAQKRDVRRQVKLDEAEESASPEPRPSEVAMAQEAWRRLLLGQPLHYQRIVHLRLLGYTLTEISEKTQVNERTVRRVLDRVLEERTP